MGESFPTGTFPISKERCDRPGNLVLPSQSVRAKANQNLIKKMIIDEKIYSENGIPFISGHFIDSDGSRFFFQKEFLGELHVDGVLTVDSLQKFLLELCGMWLLHPDC